MQGASKFQYTSVNRIMAKLMREFGLDGINESDVVEWSAEALEFIGAAKQYEEAVAVMEVENYQVNLPSNFHAIIQLAKNNCFCKEAKERTGLCPNVMLRNSTVEEDVVNPLDTPKAYHPIILDENGMPLNDYELAYYRPYYDINTIYAGWIGSTVYKTCFTPIRLSTQTISSLVCEELDMGRKYSNCRDEYTIIQGKVLRFSFKEGQVAMAYLRQPLDEDGFPMIPDHVSYTTAITKYVILKACEKEFYSGREGAAQRLQKAESDWQWYCRQAKNKGMAIDTVDEMENLLHQRGYLIPRTSEYNSFFGRLGVAENRRFNNPNGLSKTIIR